MDDQNRNIVYESLECCNRPWGSRSRPPPGGEVQEGQEAETKSSARVEIESRSTKEPARKARMARTSRKAQNR